MCSYTLYKARFMLRREVRVGGGSMGGGCVHQRTSQTLTRDGAAALNASPTDDTEVLSDLLTAAGETLGGCEMTWHEELRSRQFWRAMMAELIGTLVLVSAALGASVPVRGETPEGSLSPAVAVGAVVVVLGHCFGEISGAQVNPAVTLSLLATRRLDVLRALIYIAAQCLGALLGAGALYLALPLKSTADNFVTRVHIELNAAQALGIEVLCTFQLVFTIFSVEAQRRRDSPEPGNLAIGLAHTAGVMIGARFSGASMNPARSLGPAIITGFWENHWVYWIGPVIGAVLAGVSHEFFFVQSASRQKLVACLTCKDIEIVETTSITGSSLSTVTHNAASAKQAHKHDNN
ncbi:aquaporin AQPAe.a [Hippocampus zosterae]|uniref:aquaporin AQPAe.a n=1 Tax=Hippocampus zosterae TaxID=109293 RepID=UPI00223E66C8|nr:aquaporin AQPAe.a [Hippocampus zosterae]